MNKKLIFVLIIIFISLFISCAEPSPFVGTWADNRGDKIVFMDDGTFTATITNAAGEISITEGTYTVLMNAISFNTSSGYQTVSEWDIRGNMLYLVWTDSDGNSIQLTLYKVKN